MTIITSRTNRNVIEHIPEMKSELQIANQAVHEWRAFTPKHTQYEELKKRDPGAGSPGLPFTPDERADYRSIRESQARDYEIQERHMARHRQATPDLYLRLLAGLWFEV